MIPPTHLYVKKDTVDVNAWFADWRESGKIGTRSDTYEFQSRTMSRIFSLAHLQTIDSEIDDLSRRIHQIDQKLAGDPAVTSARAALDAEEKHLAEEQAALRAREREAQSVQAEIKDMEDRLYGGHVTSPRELEGMEKDLEMHKRQRSSLDDELLERMERIDQLQKRTRELNGHLDQMQSSRSKDIEAISREKDKVNSRLSGLTLERDQLRGDLDSEALRTYDHLRRTKAGRAVAVLRLDACGACGMAVATGLLQRVRAGDEIVFCSGCGRILSP